MNRPQTTTRLPIESDLAADNVQRLSDLINDVYDVAESGMWNRKGTRTNPAEVARLLRARALILAEIDGVLVGSVNVNLLGDGVGEFGMLVSSARLSQPGHGSGTDRTRGAVGPRTRLSHNAPRGPHTAQLDASAERNFCGAGMPESVTRRRRRSRSKSMHPELVPELATECDYTVWHKPL